MFFFPSRCNYLFTLIVSVFLSVWALGAPPPNQSLKDHGNSPQSHLAPSSFVQDSSSTSSRQGIFFSCPNFFSGKTYYNANPALLDDFLRNPDQHPEMKKVFDEANQAFYKAKKLRETNLDINFYNFLKMDPEKAIAFDSTLTQLAQLILYYALSKEYQAVQNVKFNAINFHTEGIFSALFLSGSLEFKTSIFTLYQFLEQYYKEAKNIQTSKDLHFALFRGDDTELFKDIKNLKTPDVHIRDHRHNNCVLVAGPNDSIETLEKKLISQNTHYHRYRDTAISSIPPFCFSASLLPQEELIKILQKLKIQPTLVPLIGPQGQILKPSSDKEKNSEHVFELLKDTLFKDLNTEKTFETLDIHCDQVAVVGTSRDLVSIGHSNPVLSENKCFVIESSYSHKLSSNELASVEYYKKKSIVDAALLPLKELTNIKKLRHDLFKHFKENNLYPFFYDGGEDSDLQNTALYLLFDHFMLVICNARLSGVHPQLDSFQKHLIEVAQDRPPYVYILSREALLSQIKKTIVSYYSIPIAKIAPYHAQKFRSKSTNDTPLVLITNDNRRLYLKPINTNFLDPFDIENYLRNIQSHDIGFAKTLPTTAQQNMFWMNGKLYCILLHLQGRRASDKDMTPLLLEAAASELIKLWATGARTTPKIKIIQDVVFRFSNKFGSQEGKNLPPKIQQQFQKCKKNLNLKKLDKMPKAMLHGDLHAGNIRVSQEGKFVGLIDPRPMYDARILDILLLPTHSFTKEKDSRQFNPNCLILFLQALKKELEEKRLPPFSREELQILSVLLRIPFFYDLESGKIAFSDIMNNLKKVNKAYPYDDPFRLYRQIYGDSNEISSSSTPIIEISA